MLTLPKTAATYADKAAYCYRAIERLRLWHNDVGAKVDAKDAAALKAFREWVRTEWEPRHKAASLTLHSLPGFTQSVPAGLDSALRKSAAKIALTPAETTALATAATREASAVAGLAATSWDKDIVPETFPRLNVLGEPPDPTVDLTTLTEVDASNVLTVSASRATAAWVDANTAYLYKDAGANHFAANFTHLMTMNKESGARGSCVFWGLANDVTNMGSVLYEKVVGLGALDYANSSTQGKVCFFERAASVQYYTPGAPHAQNTPWYCKVVRDEAVGTYGTSYLYRYSDAARTTLIETLTLTLHANTDFRYFYAASTYTQPAGTTDSWNGYVENHDLGEQSVVPLAMHEYMTRRGR